MDQDPHQGLHVGLHTSFFIAAHVDPALRQDASSFARLERSGQPRSGRCVGQAGEYTFLQNFKVQWTPDPPGFPKCVSHGGEMEDAS